MAESKSTNVPLFKEFNNPTRRCDWCGRRHTGKRVECRDCYGVTRTRDAERSDELTGGRWVNVRGVQRWVAYEPDPTELCGTESGYYHHLRTARTKACGDCLFAHSQAERKRAASKSLRRRYPPRFRLAERGVA